MITNSWDLTDVRDHSKSPAILSWTVLPPDEFSGSGESARVDIVLIEARTARIAIALVLNQPSTFHLHSRRPVHAKDRSFDIIRDTCAVQF